MDKMMKWLFPWIAMIILAGCQSATVRTACKQTDWYELGRRDSTVGVAQQLGNHRAKCGKAFDSLSESLYVTGYNNGLTEYCTSENGYEIGRSGANPSVRCPAPMDETFLAGVDRGQRARAHEQSIQRLDREISSLNQKLSGEGGDPDRESLLSRLSGLQAERADHERKFNQIERQIN
jgi:hypothetical protein